MQAPADSLIPADPKATVLQLTMGLNEVDIHFNKMYSIACAFIVNYHNYISSRTLLRYIGDLMKQPVSMGATHLLCIWISLREEDFRTRRKQLLEKLLTMMKDQWSVDSRNRVKLALLRARKSSSRRDKALPMQQAKSIFRVTAEDLADQLTIIDSNMFAQIRPVDYSNPGKSPRIAAMISRANNLSAWIASYILAQKDIKMQEKVARRFITISFLCSKLGNFNSTEAILRTFGRHEISRIRGEWKMGEQALIWKELSVLMSYTDNYITYRRTLAARAGALPVVPYLGIILKDFNMVTEGNPNKLDKKVNIRKLDLMATELEKISRYGAVKYRFKATTIPKNLINLKCWTDKELEAASYAIKARPNSLSICEDNTSGMEVSVRSGSDNSDLNGLVDLEDSSGSL